MSCQRSEDYKEVLLTFEYFSGLERGDVVGLWSSNCYDWIVLQYACNLLGTVLCTINPVYKHVELDHVLKKGRVKTLIMPGKGSKQEIINKFYDVIEGDKFKNIFNKVNYNIGT